MKQQKFALIGHPLDIDLYRAYIHCLKPGKMFRDELLLKLFEWAPSYKVCEFKDVSIDKNTMLDGLMIMVPFLPEMRDIKLKRVIEKIELAIKIASEEGCSIASLGAFTSILLQGHEKSISEKYQINLTSGNTFTAAVIIESIHEVTSMFGIDLRQQTLAIIGASGDIGTGCLLYFGDKVKKILATARGLPLLEQIVTANQSNILCPVIVSDNNSQAIQNADIVICATSSYTPLFSINDFKTRTIICDASAPSNVKSEGSLRNDVFLYHGGIATIPFEIDPGFDIGLASTSTMYGCQVEGILIAQDDTLPCSWGRGNITCDKIDLYRNQFARYPSIRVAYSIGKTLYSHAQLKDYTSFWLSL